MRYLLVTPRFVGKTGDFYCFPLGLAYCSSILKALGKEVRTLNLNHCAGDPYAELASLVRSYQPDVVCTGGLSVHYHLMKRLIGVVKAVKPDTIALLGGGGLTADPASVLIGCNADIGVVGEAEVTVPQLVAALETNSDISGIEGLAFRQPDGTIGRTAPRTSTRDLDDIPWPDYEGFELGSLLNAGRSGDNYHLSAFDAPRSVDLISSRSCPFPCTFCFHPLGQVYRERTLDNFFQEVDYLIDRFDVNVLSIMDELFSLKPQRMIDFCNRIKDYPVTWTVQLHVRSVTQEVLEMMRESGCNHISYGIESMSDTVLQSMRKKAHTGRLNEVLAQTRQYDIGIQGNLIFGDPAETKETAWESLLWWSQNRHFQINLTPLSFYPGAKIYEDLVQSGRIADRLQFHEDACPTVNGTTMSDDEFHELLALCQRLSNTVFLPAKNVRITPTDAVDPLRGPQFAAEFTCAHCGADNTLQRLTWDMPAKADGRRTMRLVCRSCNGRNDVPTRGPQPLPPEHLAQVQSLESMLDLGMDIPVAKRGGALLKSGVDHPRVLALIGRAFLRIGKPETAVSILTRATVLEPYDATLHLDLARCYDGLGRVREAVVYARHVLVLDPECAAAKGLLDDLLERLDVPGADADAPVEDVAGKEEDRLVAVLNQT